MIDVPLLAAFVAAASILTITPGIDTAMVLRLAVTVGRNSAMLAAVGIAFGCLLWGATVSFGLGALLAASSFAYTAMKWMGAAYLSWLGVKFLLSPRVALPEDTRAPIASAGLAALRMGFLANLLNPKVGIFYLTLLPQFTPSQENVALYSLGLACIHVALTLLWFNVLLRKPRVVKALDRLTGIVFIAFAVKLATSRT